MRVNLYSISTLLLTTIFLSAACKHRLSDNQHSDELEALLKRKKQCNIVGAEKYDSVNYTGGWNAAYAYDFVFPKVFKDSTIDVLDKEGTLLGDTAYIISPDKHAKIRMWVGETVPFPLGAVGVKLTAEDFARADSAAALIIRQMKEGNYPYFKNAKIDDICYGFDAYSQRILLQGHTVNKKFVCKTDISELPVSGDLIEKNIVFEYDSEFEQYRKIAATVVNEFTGIR